MMSKRPFEKRVREIYEREVAPLVEEYERKETFPVQLFRISGVGQADSIRNAWALAVELGTEEDQKDRIAERMLGPVATKR
jgi:hypothetical protein